ncbi:MFS transporter [Maribrevibacterium harenarium]|uniref:MFS transporter n=1 Tax=Maribrevibacterium harenarium TaxID=2589817 RepID=A0A501WH53_9GAMM|nr:MFS transporter [Maribrevibacterium harenarium]TPE47404.1 MFS transporter [Maribrevibacterium harenarium]
MFKQTLLPIWSLLFGVALITMASALQSSLIGIRASIENFDTAAAGFIMSAYYVGFIVGSIMVPNWVRNVGHIRVFAAVASMASITILAQSVIISPLFWMAMRMGTGICYAALFIVTESWLNAIATNDTRGRLFSIYIIEIWASQTLGQFLLNVGSPSGYDLFIITSVLISLALVPLLLVRTPSPTITVPEKLNIRGLIRSAPLGATAVFVAGMSSGALIGLAALYAKTLGMDVVQISIFIGASYVGGMLLQWPIGKMSDRQDRRFTLLWVSLLGGAVALVVPLANGLDSVRLMMVGMFLIGAFTFPMYSLGSSHTNDQLRPEQILSASSGLILLNGAGGVLGPIIASALMEFTMIDALFVFIALANAGVGAFAAWRMAVKPPMVVEEQGDHVHVGLTVSPVVNTELMVDADPNIDTVEELIEAEARANAETDFEHVVPATDEVKPESDTTPAKPPL